MRFDSKKIENCFSDAENYEYRIEIPGEEFVGLLGDLAILININEKLRRPAFMAVLKGGIQIKGILNKPIIKVGYPLPVALEQKTWFEHWLESL